MQNRELDAGKPLSDLNKDHLDYASYASYIAKAICDQMPTEGLVLAIHGEWGSGKSTLIEFILRHLEQRSDKDKPIIIRFNPWWFSGQESLVRHFFDQLYEVFDTNLAKFGQKATELVKEFGEAVGETFLPTGGIWKVLAGVIPSRKRKDITKLKEAISKVLLKQEQRILVVIDDIDRLNAEEIRQLFALIKSVADFPNLIYLLAFDRKVVSEALDKFYETANSGEVFLEKIIQVAFELPLLSKDDLRALLFEGVNEVIGSIPRDFYDDFFTPRGHYLNIEPFVSTPRDILRLLNNLKVSYNAVRGEVHPGDFIVIEALRTFHADIYYEIRNNKQHFTAQYAEGSQNTVVNRILQNEESHIKELLVSLFPNLRGGTFGGGNSQRWQSELRLCSPEIFDVYFRLSIPRGGVSRNEILQIIEQANQGNTVEEYFLKTKQTNFNKCRKVFERFPEFLNAISAEQAVGIIRSLLKIGDEIIYQDEQNRDVPGSHTLIRYLMTNLILELVKKLHEDSQARILKNLLTDAKANLLSINIIAAIGQTHGRYNARPSLDENQRILNLQNLPDLESIALLKIEPLLNTFTSFDDYNLHNTLHFWSFIEPEGPKSWVNTRIQSPSQLIEFVFSFCSFEGIRDRYTVSESLFLYFDPVALRRRISGYIDSNQLNEDQNNIARIFLASTEDYENTNDNRQE